MVVRAVRNLSCSSRRLVFSSSSISAPVVTRKLSKKQALEELRMANQHYNKHHLNQGDHAKHNRSMTEDSGVCVFRRQLRRTIFLEGINSKVLTERLLQQWIGQWAEISISDCMILPDFLHGSRNHHCALVCFKTEEAADAVIKELCETHTMLGGSPLPVSAEKARENMFPERPKVHKGIKWRCVPKESIEGKEARQHFLRDMIHIQEIRHLQTSHMKANVEMIEHIQKDLTDNCKGASLSKNDEDAPAEILKLLESEVARNWGRDLIDRQDRHSSKWKDASFHDT